METQTVVYNLNAASFRGFEIFKWNVSQKSPYPISAKEAVHSFICYHYEDFLSVKTKADNIAQMDEAKKYRWIKSYNSKKDLGMEAELEWAALYAGAFRSWRESWEYNGLMRLDTTITSEHGAHIRPVKSLIVSAQLLDSDLYISSPKINEPHLNVDGLPFLHVKSHDAFCEIASLGLAKGEHVTFLAYGREASELLSEVKKILDRVY